MMRSELQLCKENKHSGIDMTKIVKMVLDSSKMSCNT